MDRLLRGRDQKRTTNCHNVDYRGACDQRGTLYIGDLVGVYHLRFLDFRLPRLSRLQYLEFAIGLRALSPITGEIPGLAGFPAGLRSSLLCALSALVDSNGLSDCHAQHLRLVL